MDKPLLLIALFLSVLVVLFALFLVRRARSNPSATRSTRKATDDGSFVMMAGSDGGGSRKGSPDSDGRDSGGHDGGDGGGDGGGGGD